MFDLGWTELLVVVVVAVVVVGPKDLPRMMRAAGQWMGRARAMADQFRRSFDDMARQQELEELRAEVMKLHDDKTLAEIHRETDVMLGYLPPDPLTPVKEAKIEKVETDPELASDMEAALEAESPLSVQPADAAPAPPSPAPEEAAPSPAAEPAQSPPHRDEP